ncbi:MAG: peptidase S10, partial [Gammaproteobacteria bacterium]
MKKYLSPLLILFLAVYGLSAMAADKPAAKTPAPNNATPLKAEKSITQGSVTVEGKRIDYEATAGTIILKNKDGKPTGSMFYVAYT